MSLKLAVIYGSLNEHEKANLGFKYCIYAQEEKMKSSKYRPLFIHLPGCRGCLITKFTRPKIGLINTKNWPEGGCQ